MEALVGAGAGYRFDAGKGRPLKEWLALTASNLDWVALAQEALEFVGSRVKARGG